MARRAQPLVPALVEAELVGPPRSAAALAYEIRETTAPVRGLVVALPTDAPIAGHEATVSAAVRRHVRRRRRWRAEMRPIVIVSDAITALEMGPVELARFEGTRTDVATDLPEDLGAPAYEKVLHSGLLLADGHHRLAAARQLGDNSILALVVAPDALRLGTFHRIFESSGRLPETEWYRTEPWQAGPGVPPPGTLVWWPGSGEPLLVKPTAARSVSGFAADVIYPLLGVTEGLATHEADPSTAVASLGPDGAALLLAPPSLAEVAATVDAGQLLPPKATRFEPKPLSGLIVRDLSG